MDIFSKSREYEVEFCKQYNYLSTDKELKHVDKAHQADFSLYKRDEFLYTVELKTDFHKNSENLFIETISNTTSGRLGGPWQAQGYEAELFVVWFPQDLCWNTWIFKTDTLVQWMNENKERYRAVDIKNDGYYTRGRLIPKKDILCQGIMHCDRRTILSNIEEWSR
jgi:hypothetical protein